MASLPGGKKPRRPRGHPQPLPMYDKAGKVARWYVFVELPTSNGRRDRRKLYGDTPAEVEAKRAELLAMVSAGRTAKPERLTVRDYFTDWLEHAIEGRRSPRTFENYEYLLRVHILPAFGHRQLASLNSDDIDRFYSEKLRSGLSPSTVTRLHAVLHAALKRAVQRRKILSNPAAYVARPHVSRYQPRVLSVAECQAFLAAARGHRLAALFVLVLNSGAREGELLALRWRDISWTAGRFSIRQTVDTHAGRARLGDPKSHRSTRPIPLTPMARAALEEHRVRQDAERQAAGDRWQERGLIFTTTVGTPILASNLRSRIYRPLLRKAGLLTSAEETIRFHDLRHSAASLLLEQGVPLSVVSELLGHAGIQITKDLYGHIAESVTDAAAGVLSRLFEPDPGT